MNLYRKGYYLDHITIVNSGNKRFSSVLIKYIKISGFICSDQLFIVDQLICCIIEINYNVLFRLVIINYESKSCFD